MTTKEFIKKIEKMGYTVKKSEWCIEVFINSGYKVAHVNLLHEKDYWMSAGHLTMEKILVEFAETPLKKRVEEYGIKSENKVEDKAMKPIATELNEHKRVYHFPKNEKVELDNVIELKVSESGNHRLKTADGNLHVIMAGWLHIEITGPKDWTI